MGRAFVVVGLLYGDEGKGSITDYLVRKTGAGLVVRYNGGAQAAHNVIAPDGRHHTFSQWGAGTFAGAATFLSRHMITHPLAMMNEARHLDAIGIRAPWSMLLVDERALVVTPFHQWANRMREESRGADRHGSCGLGIGETYEDREQPYSLRFGELGNRPLVMEKLAATWEAKCHLAPGVAWNAPSIMEIARRLNDAWSLVRVMRAEEEWGLLKAERTIVFEGAQGVLLDQYRGVQPYTTWSNTTSENAIEMLTGLGFETTKIGVIRAYVTRHGPGPLATFDEKLTADLQDDHNKWNQWQRSFRCGWFDAELVRHAINIEGPIDRLAITNVDRFDALGLYHSVDAIERDLCMKASIVSRGPTANDKQER